MAPPIPAAPVKRSFAPVRTRSTVPRRPPPGSRVIRTMKVETGRGAAVLTGRSVAQARQRGVIAL
jgi:hypothetical protein